MSKKNLLVVLAVLIVVMGGFVFLKGNFENYNVDEVAAARAGGASNKMVPLMDMGTSKYLNTFEGGLYPGATNTMPTAHATAGAAMAKQVQPLDVDGNPSATGKYILMSVGFSNVTMEWCVRQTLAAPSTVCTPESFMYKAQNDSTVNHTSLVIANGAMGSQDANDWDSVTDPNYDRVRDTVLTPAGLSEKQVQIVWLKLADANPTVSLPQAGADAYNLERFAGNILRSLKVRYPNIKQVYLGSRIYGGYATSTLNPEPYAYEGGFSVKWLVAAQIKQMTDGTVDITGGDLNYNTVSPWIAWGPYLWANGTSARSDGLTWQKVDYLADLTHPSSSGINKVSDKLMTFFKTTPQASCWFLAGGVCQ